MRFFVILLIFSLCYLSNIYSRPTELEEENDSETNAGEYESDDSANNEYLNEDEETPVDETPHKEINQNGANEESEGQQIIHDSRPLSNRYFDTKAGYEMIAENENPNDFVTNGEVEIERSRAEHGYEKNGNDKLSRVASDYSEDFLFQSNHDEPNGENRALINQAINENQQYHYEKQFDNKRISENRLTKSNDYSYHVDRDRRQVPNLNENSFPENSVINNVQNENNNFNTANENAILKNIKKLSEQDLEELLNSLPEDKKALLRKIMNKREITKKAGAIEESNYLDQSDTSKIDGSFSVSSLSSVADCTETSKHDDSAESTSTKILFSKGDSEKSGSKSEDNSDTSTIIEKSNLDSKNEANLNSHDNEGSKNENKRETNKHNIINENISLENSNYSDLEDKNFNNYPIDMECSDNENWYESNNEEAQPQKRDVSQDNSLELSDSVKKLEESFSSVNANDDVGSDMEPRNLIRVKRTELHHIIKKRNLSGLASNTMSCIADLDNEENIDANKFHHKGFTNSQPSNYAKQDRNLRIDRSAILNRTQYLEDDKTNTNSLISADGQKAVSETDKIGLGSDTDSVLSGIEGVDDNIMLNGLIRNKRTLFQSDNIIEANKVHGNLIETNCKKRVMDNDIDSVPNNCMDGPRHQIDAAIGTLSLDSGEDVGRYKRMKRLKKYSKLKNM